MLLKRKDKPQKVYDIIVIGGGLGGLTSANVLAKRGKKVLILEAHNKLGGFATWFYREKKHVFDVSLHGFPVGMIKTCRKYWNKEIASLIVPLSKVTFSNPQFTLSTTFTREDFTNILVENFQVEPESVLKFFDFVFSMNFYDEQKLTVKELFEKFFPKRTDVWRLLLEPMTYANGTNLEDPAIAFGIVFSNFMNKGVYTFDCGTDKLISLMKEELLSNGVDIKLNCKVDKILVTNKQAHGVVIDNDEIHSPIVISNSHLMNTVKKMIPIESLSKKYLDTIEKVRINSSSTQVYIGLKDGVELEDYGELLFTSTANEYNSEQLLSKNITSRTFSIYKPKLRPDINRYCIVSSTNAQYEDWANLDKDSYNREKKNLIEDTIKCLEKYFHDIRNKIDYIDAATPCTIKKYTHHPLGASFGTKFEGLQVSMDLPKELKGLYHCGSVGIIMSGWLGAANYGVIIANNVERYLYEEDDKGKNEYE